MIERNILVYDFEVFIKDWMMVSIDYKTKEKTVITNDVIKLQEFYDSHASYIWVGYNSRMYDQFILKGILLGYDPYFITNEIINEGKNGWQVVRENSEITLYNFDISTGFHSLKQLEGFMGSMIKETDIPFNINRKLTEEEIAQVEFYCNHDVEETLKVFDYKKEEFDSQCLMIEAFDLPMTMFSKTKAQLSAMVLGAKRGENRKDEFDIIFPDTLQIGEKYQHIVDWYKDKLNRDYNKSLITEVAGVDHIFAWGGIHAAKPNYQAEGLIVHCDVASLYPSIMIEYDFMSRNVEDRNKYREIRDKRIKLKKEKNPMQAPLKIVLNSTYGAMKDKQNALYDPLMANNVCVAGQLLILDLIEKLEGHCELIQSNTDGLFLKVDTLAQVDELKAIAKEWEIRTRLTLEWGINKKIVQKDVNNYILADSEENYESKGAYLKKLSKIDYDLPIINKALVKFLLKGIPVRETIESCNTLHDFQRIVKVSSKYKYALHGDEQLKEKVLRVYASKKEEDKGIFKFKDGGNPEKVDNTAEHCFIYNDSVIGVECPEYLDKEYYVAMAEKRVSDFLDPRGKSKKAKLKSNIKYINYETKCTLDEIVQDDYDYFSDLVMYLVEERILKKKQIDILIKLNYFKTFGNSKELLRMLDVLEFFKFGDIKTIKKEKLLDNESLYSVVSKFSAGVNNKGKELSSFKIDNVEGILHECEKLILSYKIMPFTLKEQVLFQIEYTDGILPTRNESDRRYLYVKEMYPAKRKKDGKQFGWNIVTQSLGSGIETKFTVFNDMYKKVPIEVGEVIYCIKYSQNGKYFNLDNYELA